MRTHSSHAYCPEQEPKTVSLEVLIYLYVNVSLGKNNYMIPKLTGFSKNINCQPQKLEKSLVQYVCLHLLSGRDEINVKLTGKGKIFIVWAFITQLPGSLWPWTAYSKIELLPFRELPLGGKDKPPTHHFARLFIDHKLLRLKEIRKIC